MASRESAMRGRSWSDIVRDILQTGILRSVVSVWIPESLRVHSEPRQSLKYHTREQPEHISYCAYCVVTIATPVSTILPGSIDFVRVKSRSLRF